MPDGKEGTGMKQNGMKNLDLVMQKRWLTRRLYLKQTKIFPYLKKTDLISSNPDLSGGSAIDGIALGLFNRR